MPNLYQFASILMQNRVFCFKIRRQKETVVFIVIFIKISFILFLNIDRLMYSAGRKSCIFCFDLFLPQLLVNFHNQEQIWNLLVLTFSKHPLIPYMSNLAEIFEVKDTWCHSFIFMVIDLLEMKITLIWAICSKNCSVHPQGYQYQQLWSLEIPSKGLGCLINCF